jgi:glutaredoxin
MISRTDEQQQRVQREADKLALYHSPACLYCMMVRRTIDRLGVKIELLNVDKDADAQAELIEGGGRRTVPCLRIDSDDGQRVWMYESADIVAWLDERFAPAQST